MFIFESENGKPFKIKGIAMKKDVISKNGFYYSGQLVENKVKEISAIIEKNGSYPISMMADHPTMMSNKTLSVIGRITSMYMEGNNALIEAEIANTTVGKDVQELIRGKFVEGLSIRANNAKYKKKYIGTNLVKDVLEMDLKGVDLVVNPGVDGARITDIIESDQSDSNSLFIEILESVEIPDNYIPQDKTNEEENTLDLAELKAKYPELIESLKSEFKAIFESESKIADLQESFDSVTKEKEGIEKQLQESETKIQEFEGKILESDGKVKELTTKLEEAENKLKTIEEEAGSALRKAHIDSKLAELKFADTVKDGIRKKLEVLESTEEIDKLLESEVDYLNMVIKSATGVDVSGKGHAGGNGSGKNDKISEEEAFINLVNEL